MNTPPSVDTDILRLAQAIHEGQRQKTLRSYLKILGILQAGDTLDWNAYSQTAVLQHALDRSMECIYKLIGMAGMAELGQLHDANTHDALPDSLPDTLPDAGEMTFATIPEWTLDGIRPNLTVRFFYLSRRILSSFQIFHDCIAAVTRPSSHKEPSKGSYILHRYMDKFRVDMVQTDELTGIRTIRIPSCFEPLLLTDVEVVGTILGIADIAWMDDMPIAFESFGKMII